MMFDREPNLESALVITFLYFPEVEYFEVAKRRCQLLLADELVLVIREPAAVCEVNRQGVFAWSPERKRVGKTGLVEGVVRQRNGIDIGPVS